MPVYNDAAYLRKAIESVLNQSFRDFELLVLNDGSTDETAEVVAAFSDKRLRFIDDAANRGPAYRRNVGLREARGEFIALMDGDDIAVSDRLAKSVAAMEAHREVGILGGFAQLFSGKGDHACWTFPLHHEEICARLFFRGAFSNPTLMLRGSVMRSHGIRFDESLPLSEDYNLWYDVLRVSRGKNLPEVLVRYRVSDSQLTRSRVDEKWQTLAFVRGRMLSDLGFDRPDDEFHAKVVHPQWAEDRAFHDAALDSLLEIVRANRVRGIFPAEAFEREVVRFVYFRFRVSGMYPASEAFRKYRSFTKALGIGWPRNGLRLFCASLIKRSRARATSGHS